MDAQQLLGAPASQIWRYSQSNCNYMVQTEKLKTHSIKTSQNKRTSMKQQRLPSACREQWPINALRGAMPRSLRSGAARAKTWVLTEKDLAQSWTRHRLAAGPAGPAGDRGSTATGTWRFLARSFPEPSGPLGLRKSHLWILLYGTKFRSAESQVSSLSKVLQQIAGRFDSQQFLLAVRIAVDFGASLNWSAPLVNQPRHARYLCRHPGKLTKVIATGFMCQIFLFTLW